MHGTLLGDNYACIALIVALSLGIVSIEMVAVGMKHSSGDMCFLGVTMCFVQCECCLVPRGVSRVLPLWSPAARC